MRVLIVHDYGTLSGGAEHMSHTLREGLGLECKVGIVTRAERVILVALGLMFGLLPVAIYLLVALTTFSATQRIVHTLRQLHPQG